MLSHPVLVEAAESLFTPVCIYNNRSGDRDEATRKAFDEPAWNNPVVRFVDAAKKDLRPRLANDWTAAGLANAMVEALGKAGKTAPPWLRCFAEQEVAAKRGVDTAIFGMG